MIEKIATIREKEGVTSATVNRLLALIRSILRKAEREWKWIDKALVVSMRHEGEERERWLSNDEAKKLLKELHSHLAVLVIFSLATGLRTSKCFSKLNSIHALTDKNLSVPLSVQPLKGHLTQPTT